MAVELEEKVLRDRLADPNLTDPEKFAIIQNWKETGNLVAISTIANENVIPKADQDKVDDDWWENYRAKACRISNEQMQAFWGKVLASEINAPGSFSIQTVGIMSDMSRADAEHFTRLCSYVMLYSGQTPYLVFKTSTDASQIFTNSRLDWNTVLNLESLGLVKMGGYAIKRRTGAGAIPAGDMAYYGKMIRLVWPTGKKSIPLGDVSLTAAGRQLYSVVDHRLVPGFVQHCSHDLWKEFSKPPQ